MNTKSIIALAAGCACTSSALAGTQNFYLVGSTAFRAITINAIKDTYLNNGGAISHQQGANGDTYVTFTGTMPNLFPGDTVNVFVGWDGSVEGIQAMQGTTPATVPDHPFIDATGAAITGKAQIGMSDCFQSNTDYNSTHLTSAIIGVLPFVYARTPFGSSKLVNVTSQQLIQLWSNGSEPLAYWTADTVNDGAAMVYALGRYDGSGTRLEATADSGYGIGQGQALNMWDTTLTPAAVNAYHDTAGRSGFNGGGDLKNNMNLWPAKDGDGVTPITGIAYLGVGDANGLSGNGLSGSQLFLTCNGVAYSAGAARNGSYSFWSYEHCNIRPDGGVSVTTYVNGKVGGLGLVAELKAEVAATAQADNSQPTAISNDANMLVARNTDGSPIAR
jgi:hypothetical protein